jgi:glycosyltransferase involved in cell wall biosynthesis
MPKVVHLTTVHRPSDVRIYEKECRALAESGHEIVLIAPRGECEAITGVRLELLPPEPRRVRRMTLGMWRLWRAAVREDAALYHFHDPELILVAWALRASRRRVIYDVHEDVPRDILAKEYLPDFVRWLVSAAAIGIERVSGWTLTGIVAATPAIASRFPPSKTRVVRNYPRLAEFDALMATGDSKREDRVIYVGGLSRQRGAREMVAAAALWHRRIEAPLALAGRFTSEGLEDMLKRTPGWDRIAFLGWLDRRALLPELARARVGLAVLHPNRAFVESLPVKLFEYMAPGVAVVVSDFPQWKEIVERTGCGLVVNPLDPAAISDAVLELLTHPERARAMGERGRKAIKERYNWEQEALTLVEFCQLLLHE